MNPTEIAPEQTQSDPIATERGPDPTEPESAQRRGVLGVLKMDRGEMLVAVVLMAFSAWLWSRLPGNLGTGAPFYGAGVGLAITYLARYSC